MSLLIAIGFFALTEGKHASSSKTLPDRTVIHSGDPSQDDYKDSIPNVPNPLIFVIRQVTGIDNSDVTQPIIQVVATEYI